jgi:hypothetical protein
MKKKFEFEFEDSPSNKGITFEYAEEVEERMTVTVENGVPVIYANREGFLLLARTCAKFGLGSYSSGFHVHLTQDFDEDKGEALRLVLDIES